MNLINFIEICEGILYADLRDILQFVFNAIKIATPILAVVLIMMDFISASASGKEEDMQKAQSRVIKRLIIAVIIFLLPVVVELLLNLIGHTSGACGIG